jgi:hypothetical protein
MVSFLCPALVRGFDLGLTTRFYTVEIFDIAGYLLLELD